MLISMTGYGRVDQVVQQLKILVEVKCVNSKSLDIRTKISSAYASKEIEIRKLIQQELKRGKVDINVLVEDLENSEFVINEQVFNNYLLNLRALSSKFDLETDGLMAQVLKMPGVVAQNETEVDENAWNLVKDAILKALKKVNEFRKTEGVAMMDDILNHIQTIEHLLDQVDPMEEGRIEKIRERLTSSLEALKINSGHDENRLEQEMIFYMDKYDLNEEKIRLAQHCKYFKDMLDIKDEMKGKNLSFILQEIGREINTLGSKANSAEIQKVVIQMKNEADKIKEQLANVV